MLLTSPRTLPGLCRPHPLAAAAAALCLTGAAHAQQAGAAQTVALAPGQHLPAVTVTATMTEQDARTAPASVTVITAEELAERNASDLLDAVRGAPGITLTGRQVGGRKTLALRGLEGKHTLTLIDGRRISASDDVIGHSDYQYGWLPISAIERIEVIRGPMSALYGSEALGGVINIISKKPRDRWSGSVGVSGATGLASDAASEGGTSVYAAGPLGERARLSVNAEYAQRNATPDVDDRRYSEIEGRKPRNLGLNAEFDLTARQRLQAGISDGKELRLYDDVNSAGRTYRNRYDLDRRQTHVGWTGDFGDTKAQLRAYRSEMSVVNTRTNGVAPTRPQDMRDDVVDGHVTLRRGGHQIALGGEWRSEELVNAGLKGGRDDVTHKALFVQDEFALGANLMATLGLRADHHGIFGSELSPRAYLVWEASPRLVVKGGYGHAFKAPTLKQISPNYVGAEGPHSFLGNANIQPETSNSLEIGADWQAAPGWSLRATAFHTEVKQLITYRLQQQIGVRRIYQYDNVDAARIQGLEAGFTWAITPQLAWSTDATLLHTRDKTTGQRLNDRPRASVASHLAWRAVGWDARLGLQHTGGQDSSGYRLPAYTLWNASLGRAWKLNATQSLQFRAGLENLGNARLAEKSPNFGYAEQGRRVFLSARLDF
ncbi:TonB-dependent receptor plug domain-containing protein [Alicycliphilus denitrificans]|uniref:TonB-dependent receptor plug domain-containing protein n=1 Tax=Alicycliphilus denitrificans TaxID=179636 RepID=UPI0038505B9F